MLSLNTRNYYALGNDTLKLVEWAESVPQLCIALEDYLNESRRYICEDSISVDIEDFVERRILRAVNKRLCELKPRLYKALLQAHRTA